MIVSLLKLVFKSLAATGQAGVEILASYRDILVRALTRSTAGIALAVILYQTSKLIQPAAFFAASLVIGFASLTYLALASSPGRVLLLTAIKLLPPAIREEFEEELQRLSHLILIAYVSFFYLVAEEGYRQPVASAVFVGIVGFFVLVTFLRADREFVRLVHKRFYWLVIGTVLFMTSVNVARSSYFLQKHTGNVPTEIIWSIKMDPNIKDYRFFDSKDQPIEFVQTIAEEGSKPVYTKGYVIVESTKHWRIYDYVVGKQNYSTEGKLITQFNAELVDAAKMRAVQELRESSAAKAEPPPTTPPPSEPEPAKVVQAKAPAKTEKAEKVIAPIPAPPLEPAKTVDPPAPPPPVKLFNEGEVVVKTLGQVKEYEPYRINDDIVLTRLAGDMQYHQVPLVPERTLIRFEITSAEEVGGKKDTYLLSLSPRQLIVFDDSGKPDSHVFPENVTAGQLTAKKPGKLSKIANIFKRPEVVGPTAGAIIGGVAGGGKGAAEGAIIGLGAGLVLKYGTPYGAMTHGAPVEIPAQQEIRFAIR